MPLPDKPSVVVIPFTNLSGDSSQEYFSDGFTDELTTDLSRIPQLFVIARQSAFTYKGKQTKVQDLRRELGVRYVLEGSVQRTKEQLRILVQLSDATTGEQIWAERYDRPVQDLFALHDDIVRKIVTTLRLQLGLREQGILARKTTDNLEAYDYYLRGLESFYRTTKEDNLQARQMYEKAVALDLQYAEAYARLGATYYLEWGWGWSQDAQTIEQGLVMTQRAVALDDSLSFAHGLLGMLYAMKKQLEQALAESERAIALDPNDADSYRLQAETLNLLGRPEEALRAAEQALRLNPRAPAGLLINLGLADYLSGRYSDAISTLKSLVARYPDWMSAYPLLTFSYVQQWHFQLTQDSQTLGLALEAAQRSVALNNAYSQSHLALGAVYLFQRQYEQAIAEMQQAIALDPHEAFEYALLAVALGWAGKSDEALQMVEQALQRKSRTVEAHLGIVGGAYYFAGKSEEAVASLRQYLSRYPNILGPHLNLAAAYSELGKDTEARAEAAEVRRINPNFSLTVHKERVPIKDPATLERHIAALRKAGLK